MTRAPEVTPLDKWMKVKIGDGCEGQADIFRYQLEKLRHIIDYARTNSPFYKEKFKGLPAGFPDALEGAARIPFTTESELRDRHLDMLCISQGRVARVVTLQTTGSTAKPKRLYFTDEDLELTVDFFRHGMMTLAEPGDKVLVFMPGRTPGSIGNLLAKALNRMDVECMIHGPVFDPTAALDDLMRFKPDCLVGLPVQMLGLARNPKGREISRGNIKSVLLSADYVPQPAVDELAETWGASVYEHYGMTEMGLGGGVQCDAKDGYHLREPDLFFEVIDPVTGIPVSDGQAGEVVFTTLTRTGMPLIRYRTGDEARFLTTPCPCGGFSRRLGKVTGRISVRVPLKNGGRLCLAELDDVLFRIPGLLNFRAEVRRKNNLTRLELKVYAERSARPGVLKDVERRLLEAPSVLNAVDSGELELGPVSANSEDWPTDGTVKRILIDRRLEKMNEI